MNKDFLKLQLKVFLQKKFLLRTTFKAHKSTFLADIPSLWNLYYKIAMKDGNFVQNWLGYGIRVQWVENYQKIDKGMPTYVYVH